MIGIPPISSSQSTPSPSSGSLAQQLEQLIQELQTDLKEWTEQPPKINTLQVEQLVEKIKTFLDKNKKALFTLAKNQGWPPNGPDGYETFFNGTEQAIETFMFRPNPASLMMANSTANQLHWLITNRNPHP